MVARTSLYILIPPFVLTTIFYLLWPRLGRLLLTGEPFRERAIKRAVDCSSVIPACSDKEALWGGLQPTRALSWPPCKYAINTNSDKSLGCLEISVKPKLFVAVHLPSVGAMYLTPFISKRFFGGLWISRNVDRQSTRQSLLQAADLAPNMD